MKKLISITLSILMIASTMILCVGAVSDQGQKTESISMTVYDPETGEETVETYQVNADIIAALSAQSKASAQAAAMESYSVAEQALGLLSGDSEFTDIGLSKVGNTTVMPYSPIGFLKTFKTLSIVDSLATAFMISDNVAVTAAHCLYNKKNGKWIGSAYFYPGKHGFGVGNDPYGRAYARKWAVCTQYIENTDENLNKDYDWGAFVLDKPIGQKCGKLTLSPLSFDEIANADAMTAGYPQYREALSINYSQYTQQSRVTVVEDNHFKALIDCMSGQSGSPVFVNNTVCGIVSGRAPNGDYSAYTRINDTVYAYLMQYAADNA